MTPDFLSEFEFFAGVPDSQLKALCSFLMDRYGLDPAHHVIAANEGGAGGGRRQGWSIIHAQLAVCFEARMPD